MKILNKEKVDQCTGKGRVIEVYIDSIITEQFITYLKTLCDVVNMKKYHDMIYIARMQGKFVVKGIIGSDKLSVVFEKENVEQNIQDFLELISKYGA